MKTKASENLFEKAKNLIPGGVNSPVRACGSVGTFPRFMERGESSAVFDADGNRYIDFVGSWGPLILGHRHPKVMDAIGAALLRGTTFGAPIDLEVALAEKIVRMVPSMERVRMVNSGTEATMSAIRLARAATGRDGIIKFDGCYHGHADSLLVAAGSGVATLGIPGSPGVPQDTARLTLSLPFNDLSAVKQALAEKGDSIAAVIVEPVGGNMGVVPPAEGFLSGLRDLTREHGVVLIFDEVMTGFRVAPGGAQQLFGVTPDLTCLGKIIGGGLPVGAYGGRADLMSRMAPEGDVYQAGTLSGNPLAMAAGLATLQELSEPGFYEPLEELSAELEKGLSGAARQAGVDVCINRVGSMLTVFFRKGPVTDFASAKQSAAQAFAAFYNKMANQGVSLPPSQFEAWFVSGAHTEADVEKTVQAAVYSFGK